MNKTPNYSLNQWEADDRVLRADFNADNAKIDAALAALPVELRRVKLTGTAKKIAIPITASWLTAYRSLRVCTRIKSTSGSVGIQANGITSGYRRYSAGSVGGDSAATYAMIATSGGDSCSTTEIISLAGGIILKSDSASVSASNVRGVWEWCFLRELPYQSLAKLEIVLNREEDNLFAGSEAVLYGLR